MALPKEELGRVDHFGGPLWIRARVMKARRIGLTGTRKSPDKVSGLGPRPQHLFR